MAKPRTLLGEVTPLKAADFRYVRPKTLEAALSYLAGEADAMPLAGGQSLMPMMNFRLAAPELLVDLNDLSELDYVSASPDGWLEIGAMTRYRTLSAHPHLPCYAPLIAKALPHVAHAAIRNRGTVGGSIALADPAAELPAILLALAGEVVLQGPSGERVVEADDYVLGPYMTAREDGELVTKVRIPLAKDGDRFGFCELTRRHGDYAMAGCFVAASHDFEAVRIALFGVADRPVRSFGAEVALQGHRGDDADLEKAVAALTDVEMMGDVHNTADTKQHLAGVALKRAFLEARG
ncbi:MAG: xanthine dehydrogenase family protein subunit M [Pseudomonadota bacterium]